MKLSLAVAAALLACSSARAQDAAPAEVRHETAARAPIYDEQADARAVIAAAVARAGQENRRVLIQWGANWCGWCTVLHDTFKKDRALAKELLYEYDLVHVNVGRFDRNAELTASYGVDFKGSGIPYLTVLDSDGKVLANQATGPLEKPVSKNADGSPAMGYQTDKVLEFLKKHEATPRQAQEVLDRALADAKSRGKVVFLHFGAPWCIWCHRMEDWMARPEVARVLGRSFVDVKIDVDRMPGGKEVLSRYNPKKAGGIPWFAFVGPDGTAVADSTAEAGNVGFPVQDSEIAHFRAMLEKAGVPAADAAVLVESLRENAKTLR